MNQQTPSLKDFTLSLYQKEIDSIRVKLSFVETKLLILHRGFQIKSVPKIFKSGLGELNDPSLKQHVTMIKYYEARRDELADDMKNTLSFKAILESIDLTT